MLSERDDIIVVVDEAHRTQYKDLAENMRKGLPNAQYIAFTGTPLLGGRTKQRDTTLPPKKQLSYLSIKKPITAFSICVLSALRLCVWLCDN